MRTSPTLLSRLVVLLAALGGCVVYTDGPKNYAPEIGYADAGCTWDPYQGTYVLYFDVDATDPNGAGDVVDVSADVYDDGNGAYLATYALFPEVGPTWYSAWIYSTTKLDPAWTGYSADIVATDAYGVQTVVTVPMWACY